MAAAAPDPLPPGLAPAGGLFDRLRGACAEEWRAYTHHRFVAGLADGSLPAESFRHYLVQDYLFLFHFARAFALAAYKSETLEELGASASVVTAIVETEMALHVGYCRGWGLSEAEMQAAPEATATLAYTRYVLERGLSGDLLDLYVALAPCTIGYGEIGLRLAGDPATKRDGNPYSEWIAMYSGEEYLAVARGQAGTLDRLWRSRAGEGRFAALVATFRAATRLEAAFWEMGWTLAG